MGGKKRDLGDTLHSWKGGGECGHTGGPLVTLVGKGSSVKHQGEFQTLIKDNLCL